MDHGDGEPGARHRRYGGTVADVLYERIAACGIAGDDVFFSSPVHGDAGSVEHLRLLPLDLSRFEAPAPPIKPLITLDPPKLLARLTEEYMYARLCEASLQAFAAENEARMRAMTGAGDRIGTMLNDLTLREHRVRQAEVTAEVVELATNVEAQRGSVRAT